MAKIKYVEDKKGVRIYPITTEQAVRDDNGITLDVKLANITGGMDIVELSSASGVLTDEQFELVQSDHCIVKYDGYNYYKYSGGESECVYNRVTETKEERTTTDYYFTCTFSSKEYSFSTTVTPAGSPDAVKYVEQELTSEQKAQARENIGAGTYSKPASGIPSGDLSSGVQNSLSKANSAYQKPASGIPASDLASGAVPEQLQSDWNQDDSTAKDFIKNKPNIPSAVSDVIKYTPQTLSSSEKEQARSNIGAGTYSKPVNGIPANDLAAGVVPDVSTKQDLLVSGENIKTINSTSILGPGDITVQDGVGFESVSSNQDGTILITLTNGDTITVDLNHNHPQYPKYVLCDDESEYEDITTKESDTLYLIKDTE